MPPYYLFSKLLKQAFINNGYAPDRVYVIGNSFFKSANKTYIWYKQRKCMEAAKPLVAEINQYLTQLNTEQQKAVLTVVKTFAASQEDGKKDHSLKDIINDFSTLQPNWDSYNANAISKTAIQNAIDTVAYLNRPEFLSDSIEVHVFPMRDGGIQFEFDGKNNNAELEISPEGKYTFISFDNKGNLLYKKSVTDLSQLSALLEHPEYA